MPLEPETSETVSSFIERKRAQWLTLAAPHGVQMVQSGERGTQISIGWNLDDVHESVIIGQWPHVVLKNTGSPRNPVRRPAHDHEKPAEKRAVDLTDAEIEAVIAGWLAGRSATELDLPQVYLDGKLA